MLKNTLYITFDGLSDPLGQSQILPYLIGIAQNGFHIHILSCEKKERLDREKENILSRIKNTSIEWDYIIYKENGSFFSRLQYIHQLRTKAYRLRKTKNFSLVHCRSYLASLIGLNFKRQYNIPFLFDARGFWADERIDGGIWKKSNPIENLFYNFFKQKEKQFILRSDANVFLTNAAVTELEKFFPAEILRKKTTVIPCCTNTNLFSKENAKQISLPNISENAHILVYTGSIGTWYYTKEMIDCVLAWKKFIPEIKLLVLTNDKIELEKILSLYNEEEKQTVVSVSASHKDVASYLVLAKASIFFIKPAYSKIASSPTKMAECWAMDLPIITNSGIGDNDLFFNTHQGGILTNAFTEEEYETACKKYLALSVPTGTYRKIASDFFDNTMAIEKYTSIYKSLTKI
ncbi:MAG: glycosyltransferase [Bacteroidetes bacterium]|nr:glycosyltransferase [Bacteroidota bacterium]